MRTKMKCPNTKCKQPIDENGNKDTNFDYCKECGTVVYRNKNKD